MQTFWSLTNILRFLIIEQLQATSYPLKDRASDWASEDDPIEQWLARRTI